MRLVVMDFSSSSSPVGGDNKVDPELAEFVQMESQRAQFQGQIHRMNELCWDTCFDKPRDKLDSRTETCVTNCVERFIDTSLLLANRFQQMIQKAGQ